MVLYIKYLCNNILIITLNYVMMFSKFIDVFF